MKILKLIIFLISLNSISQNFKNLEKIKEVYVYDTITYLNSKIDLTDNSFEIPSKIVVNSFLPQMFPKRDFNKDSQGVKLSNKDKYKPTAIMALAMSSYYEYKKTKNKQAKVIFLNQVKWLKNNFYTYKENYGFWLFPNKSRSIYKLAPYWNSALTQGFGIDVCFLAFDITKDITFLKMAKLAFKGFLISISYGGFQREINGYNWYEEYPTEKPSMVLNGYIFSLAGLKNYYDNTSNNLAEKMFEDGVKSLEYFLPKYDIEFSSKYMLMEVHFPIAKEIYHKLHIEQLLWIYLITQKKVFYDSAKKFLEMRKSNFRVVNQDIKRIKSIKICNSFNANKILNNKNWGWGKHYCFQDDVTEIDINFFDREKIYGISLFYQKNEFFCKDNLQFYSGEKSVDFEIINEAEKKLGNKKVSIRTYHFKKRQNSKELKMIFENIQEIKPFKLFEINAFIDLTEEIDAIINKLIDKEEMLTQLSSL